MSRPSAFPNPLPTLAQLQRWGWAIFLEPTMHDITTITLESQRPRPTTTPRERDWRPLAWTCTTLSCLAFWIIFIDAIRAMIWGR